MAEIEHLAPCISCHAFNKDQSLVALCPNNNEIHIYKKVSGGKYEPVQILAEHDQLITGLDWAPNTNRIVSCSQDRNAYVWQYIDADQSWKPTLVILRINRAATSVKWSPKENKFAVASGSKCVSVCYFEEDNDWWVSKHIKKHKSTVLTVSWHPNNILLATGSSDFKARIFAAPIKGIDKKSEAKTAFGDSFSFGDMLAEFPSSGWVHGIDWSPSGDRLAFVSHDSSISFVNDVTSPASLQKIACEELPFRALIFTGENSVVAAGHDCNPVLFSFSGSWGKKGFVDVPTAKAGASKEGTAKAFDMFKSQATKGTTEGGDTSLPTKHQNTISSLFAHKNGGAVVAFSSTGVDGNLALWPLAGLTSLFAGLAL
eukprot:TRINITY_DN472_c0_g1_i1.p1 TRINITY_DN472_c0_g1~~TRINITY_DN472_c0_g1_i1.p1  ORF type:complete len:387 (-),score=95.61 TRINITY_DN472_c0_g1_i1:116-1231(-)